jgi:hypothetical protein
MAFDPQHFAPTSNACLPGNTRTASTCSLGLTLARFSSINYPGSDKQMASEKYTPEEFERRKAAVMKVAGEFYALFSDQSTPDEVLLEKLEELRRVGGPNSALAFRELLWNTEKTIREGRGKRLDS